MLVLLCWWCWPGSLWSAGAVGWHPSPWRWWQYTGHHRHIFITEHVQNLTLVSFLRKSCSTVQNKIYRKRRKCFKRQKACPWWGHCPFFRPVSRVLHRKRAHFYHLFLARADRAARSYQNARQWRPRRKSTGGFAWVVFRRRQTRALIGELATAGSIPCQMNVNAPQGQCENPTYTLPRRNWISQIQLLSTEWV